MSSREPGRGRRAPLGTSTRGPRTGVPRGFVRLVLTLGLLAGLIAMHGFGAGHHLDAGTSTSPAADSMSDMADLSVAVLTGAVALALLLVRPLRALPAHRVSAARSAGRVPGRALRLRRPPDLSVLCVLRT